MDTSTTRSANLLRKYNRDTVFEPCERSETRFWDDMKEADDVKPSGDGLFFRIIGSIGHAYGNPAEAGDWTTARERIEVQCEVNSAQIDYTVELSTKYLALAQGEGSFFGDPEEESVTEATVGILDYANRLLGVGHKTGRLAIVDVSVVGSQTITLRKPEMAFQLRPNQPIDFATLDSGGTVMQSAIIDTINYRTGIITVDTPVTVTAGWGIYQADAYGNPFSDGLRSIVDDGDLATSIFTQSRTGQNGQFLNAYVEDPGTLEDYSEDMIRKFLSQIALSQNLIPTELRSNEGIMNEHYARTTADRFWLQTGKPPDYNIGANHERLAFTYGSTNIPWKYDRNLPARSLYALYKPGFRKHTLRKLDWNKDGDEVLMLKPAAGGETYTHAKIGNIMMDIAISARKLNANGLRLNIRDSHAGD